MYKDVKKRKVWKRVLSAVMCTALVITVVQWPEAPVKAQDGVVSHYYTYAPGDFSAEGTVTTIDEKTAAVVFSIGKNDTFGKEQLASISFDTCLTGDNEEAVEFAKTAVYMNPTSEDPTSGTYLCEVSGTAALVEGTNNVSLEASNYEVERDTRIAVVVSLEGENYSFYADEAAETGRSYILADGAWSDAAGINKCVNISMTTYDVAEEETAETEEDAAEEPVTSLAQIAQDAEEVQSDLSADEIAAQSETEDVDEGIAVASETASPIDINSAAVELISNAMKSADASTPVYPEIEVTYGGQVLNAGTDYTIQTAYIYSGAWNTTGSTATLVISGQGSYTNTRAVSYTICDDINSVITADAIAAQTYTGTAIEPSASYTIADGASITQSDLVIKYENNVNAGEATVKIMPRTSTSYGGCVEQKFTINPVDLSSSQVSYDCASATTYNPTPSGIAVPAVGVSYRGTTLSENVDYTVSSKNFSSVGTNGQITVTAVSGSNFTGSKTLDVAINPCSLNDSHIVVDGVAASYVYTGAAIKPQFTMRYDDTVICSDSVGGSVFDVTYENNVNYGTGKIVITPKSANYTGTKTISFKITKKQISSDTVTVSYSGTRDTDGLGFDTSSYLAVKQISGSTPITLEDGLTVRYGSTTLVKDTDYTLSYQYNSVVSTSTRLAEVTVEGKDNYEGSMTIGFLIVGDINDTTIKIPASASYRAGAEVTFAESDIVVKKNSDVTLAQDSDYSVSYSHNTAVSTTAVVNIEGRGELTKKGCYVGTVHKTFAITKKNIAEEDVEVEVAQDITYPVNELSDDTLTITYNGTELVLGDDVTITGYTNNSGPGTATATLKGIGDNYQGTRTVSFKILGIDISEYSVTQPENQTYTGAALIPDLTVTDKSGNELKAANYTVHYFKDDEAVNAVKDAGEYDIMIEGKGDYSGEITGITFYVAKANIASADYATVAAIANKEFTGYEIEPTVVVNNAKVKNASLKEGTDYTVSNWSNNRNVSTETQKATATITGIGNYEGTTSVSFTITPASISKASFSQFDAAYPFNENGVTPSFTMTLGDYSLTLGTDYTVEYSNNTVITSSAKVTVTGIGNFTGTKSQTFVIKADINDTCSFSISGAAEDGTYKCNYTGTAIKPTVVVTNNSTSAALKLNTDYTVTYADNTNAGEATVTIAGKGNYTGQTSLNFNINPVSMADVTVTLDKTEYDYTGSQITPNVKSAKLGTYTLNSNDPYEIIYGANTDAGIGTVQLRSTGDNIIGESDVYNFTINPKSIGSGSKFFTNISMDAIPTQDYTGSPITPDVLLHYKSVTDIDLVQGTDYDVLYENNIDAGTATITITAKGNYGGTVTQTFNIARNIAVDTTVVTAEAFDSGTDYTGNAITLGDLAVYLDGLDGDALAKSNYIVSYENNTNAGVATVTITGNEKSYYTGTITKEFNIYGNLAAETTTIEPIEDIPRDPTEADGTEYIPSAIVIRCGGVELIADDAAEGYADYGYAASYENHTKIGTATATITAAGTYIRGETTVDYDIVPANDVFLFTYTDEQLGAIPDQKYCGKAIEFDTEELPFVVRYVNETDGVDRELVCGTDYELSYENNTDAGTATVTATGIGKYKHANSNSCTFTIVPLRIEELVIDDAEFLTETDTTEIGARTYTGKKVVPHEMKLLSMDGDEIRYTLQEETDYNLTAVETTGEGETLKEYPYVVGEKTAAVMIEGTGTNCIGQRMIEFDIRQKDIATTEISVPQMSFTSYPLTPEVVVTNPENDDLPLVYETDYYVEYDNNIDAGEGIVRVVANEGGNYTGSAEATFKIAPLNISKTDSVTVADIPDQPYNGTENRPSVNVVYTDIAGVPNTLVEGVDYELTYAANTKAGTARVTIDGIGNYTGSLTKAFTVAPMDIASDEIAVDEIENQAYTGSAVTPAVTVKHGETVLKSGVDYSVTYANNTQLGMATATVFGKGNYTGSRTLEFKIASDISQAKIASGVASEYNYTGTAITPVPVGVSIGNTYLVAGKDYTVTYEDNVEVGVGAVILSGLAEYGGTKRIEFVINQKNIADSDITLEGFSSEAAYTESEVKLPIGLKYGTVQLEEQKDFVVSYRNNFALGTASLEIVGIGNYTGSIEREFEIVKKSVADEDVIVSGVSSTYVYDGAAIAPVPTLTYGEETLVADYDYTVEYAKNDAIGTATMTINGIGRYQGTREVKINILRKSVANCQVSGVGAQIYTGDDIEPTVTVKDGSKALNAGTDYTLMYSNNRKAGTGSVIVAGKGNYTVTKTIRFDIRPSEVGNFLNTSTSSTSAGFSWTCEGAVTGYEIYRAGADGKFTRIARAKGTSYIDGDLSSGTAYSYRIRSYLISDSETYYSSFSDVVNITTN